MCWCSGGSSRARPLGARRDDRRRPAVAVRAVQREPSRPGSAVRAHRQAQRRPGERGPRRVQGDRGRGDAQGPARAPPEQRQGPAAGRRRQVRGRREGAPAHSGDPAGPGHGDRQRRQLALHAGLALPGELPQDGAHVLPGGPGPLRHAPRLLQRRVLGRGDVADPGL